MPGVLRIPLPYLWLAGPIESWFMSLRDFDDLIRV